MTNQTNGSAGPTLEFRADIVQLPDGTAQVRTIVAFGPVAAILALPPAAMRQICESYAKVLRDEVPEAERHNAMPGFQVVAQLPKLPPIDGQGSVGHG